MPVMVCMDGFILTHAYERVDIPDAGRGRRLPAAVRAAPGARSGRSGVDRRDGRAGGLHGGALPRARQAAAALELHPAASPPSSRSASAATRAASCAATAREDAETIVVALGSVIGTVKEVGRRDARQRRRGSARSRHQLVPPVPARRGCARRCSVRERVVVLEKCFCGRPRRHRLDDVRKSLCRASQLHGYTVVAGLGGRAITRASLERSCSRTRSRRARAGHLPRSRLATSSTASSNARARRAAAARSPRSHAAPTSAPSRRHRLKEAVHGTRPIKFYQTGTFTVGNRLLAPEQRTVQADMHRTNSLNSGHRACQGCGEALGARYAIDAAMRATGNQLIAVNATGCLEVFSTPYPETSWQMPWIHSLFGNAAAVASASPRRSGRWAGRRATCASSRRAATAARPTSASAASPACSSATTTCSTSATTTRPT